MTTREEYEMYKNGLGIQNRIICNEEENEYYRSLIRNNQPFPLGVYRLPGYPDDRAAFCIIQKTDMSKDEIAEYLQMKQLAHLDSIRRSVTFLTVLTCISIGIALIIFLSSM